MSITASAVLCGSIDSKPVQAAAAKDDAIDHMGRVHTSLLRYRAALDRQRQRNPIRLYAEIGQQNLRRIVGGQSGDIAARWLLDLHR